jgi:hypothetical protein
MNFQYYVSKFAVNKGCSRIPIEQIDGVDVVVWMEYNPNQDYAVMRLEIHIKNDPFEEPNIRRYIKTEDDFEKYFDELLHLKFDKMKNEFVDGRVEQIPFEFYSRLISPNIKLIFEDCCVCLEKTSGKTHCQHAICKICMSKMKTRKCPLCRACVECLGECGCESDDESDE